MVESIGPIGTSEPRTAPPLSGAGLQAELARAKSELADCLTCATADTPSGKAKIQQVQSIIRALSARLENLQRAPEVEQSPPAKIAPEPSSLGSQIDLSA